MSIYVRDADGNRQKIAGVGLPGPAGKSAYQYAVEGGFSGTEEEFKALVGIRSNSNLLDNANFLDPINQRGQTEYRTENGQVAYTIDRWLIGWNAYTKISTGGVDITSDFYQKLPPEVLAFIAGKEVTISLLTDKSLYSCTGIYDGTNNVGDGGPVVLSPYYGGSPCFAILGEASNYETLIAVKLELGPVQTLAHKDASGNWVLNDPPPDPTLELAKCQRYFVVYGRDIGLRLPEMSLTEVLTGAASFSAQLPQEMRIAPVIINNNALATRAANGRGDMGGSNYTYSSDKRNIFVKDSNATIQEGLRYRCSTYKHNGILIIDANL